MNNNLIKELAIAVLEGDKITSGLKPGVPEDVAAEMGRQLAIITECIEALHETSGPSPEAHAHVTRMLEAVDRVDANKEIFSDPHTASKMRLLSLSVQRMNEICYEESRKKERLN